MATGAVRVLDDRGDVLPMGWSPDSRSVLFTASNGSDQVWLYDLEKDSSRELSAEYPNIAWARFSPDGQKIAYSVSYQGIYTVDLSGGAVEEFVTTPYRVRALEWVSACVR